MIAAGFGAWVVFLLGCLLAVVVALLWVAVLGCFVALLVAVFMLVRQVIRDRREAWS